MRTSVQSVGLHKPSSFLPLAATRPVIAKAKDLDYMMSLLGKAIEVHIAAGIPGQVQRAIKLKINHSITIINLAASKLTTQQKEIIHLLNGIIIAPSQDAKGLPTATRTGIDVQSGVFTLLDSYVTAPGVTPPFFASDMAHDSFHIWQHLHGQENTRENAAKLERDADDFQIAVGRHLGLTDANIKYLQNDTHTGYNTGRY